MKIEIFFLNFLLLSYLFRYGTIISTKAILDKTTNKCKGIQLRSLNMIDEKFYWINSHIGMELNFKLEKFFYWISKFLKIIILVLFLIPGYGFVDFESPACAEGAVKGLQAKGIQAQMAKVGIWVLHRPAIVRLLIACK